MEQGAGGLDPGRRDGAQQCPLRLYDLLRERGHVLLLYGHAPVGEGFDAPAAVAREASQGRVEACAVLGRDADGDGGPAGAVRLPVYRDTGGEFARLYRVGAATAFVVQPDGCLGARLCPPDADRLAALLARVFHAGPDRTER
jgi:hypothetical protein